MKNTVEKSKLKRFSYNRTVDWDGAIASGKEVARFGAELWERLNGKEEAEGFPSIAEIFGQVNRVFCCLFLEKY